MNDMRQAIVPKSDQLNANDLIGGRTITIKISGVTFSTGSQPVSVHYEGDGGKPWKPCKNMCRAMIIMWDDDDKKYVGRFLRLYRDPDVAYGGLKTGGIRISHASHIDGRITMVLNEKRGVYKPFTVNPLRSPAEAPLGADMPPANPAAAQLVDDADAAAGNETETDSERIARLDKMLADAAGQGTVKLAEAVRTVGANDRDILRAAYMNRHKPRARAVDDARAQEQST